MAERDVKDLTLRELFSGAERLTRELIDHLEQGFLFKARALAQLVAPTPGDPVYEQIEDLTIRNQADNLLKSEDFTDRLYRRLEQYYSAIDENVTRISTGR